MMRHETPTLRELRARVQTTLESMARHDGEELTAEDVRQLCGAMMMYGKIWGRGAIPHPRHPGRDA